MGAALVKVSLLLEHGRYEAAERELRDLIAAEPNDATYRRMLSVALAQQGKQAAALHEAREAVRLEPGQADSYYALGHAHLLLDEHKDAEAAARRAIELDPQDPAHFALLSTVMFARSRFADALAAAERGLAIDAEHDGCAHARARALTYLGRHDAAGDAIADALRRHPEDDVAHCNLGWSLLAQGKPQEAAAHFREALRIDPKYAHAREGLIESLKARHATWAALLRFLLWAARWPSWLLWVFIIGVIVATRLLRVAMSGDPYLRAIYRVFAVAMTLGFILLVCANALFTMFLRWSSERNVLSPEQRRAASINSALFAAAVVALAAWPLIGFVGALIGAAVAAVLMPAVARACETAEGRPRMIVWAYVIGVALLGVLGAASRLPHALLGVLDLFGPLATLLLIIHGFKLFVLFLVGAYLTDWFADRVEKRHRLAAHDRYDA